MKTPESSHVFHTLDVLRGVAAIAVMAFHYSGSGALGVNLFPHGYLAVDFFFVLSGFVLAFAYQDRLDAGWSTRSFLLTRVVRLYPLYFAGLALGLLFSILQSHFGRNHLSAAMTFLILLASLLLVPAFGLKQQQVQESTIYPFNKPSWSLFFEILANVFHAFLLRRRSQRFLIGTLCLTGAAFVYSSWKLGTLDFGVMRQDIPYGIARVLFSYTFGMLLLMVWRSGRIHVRVSPLVIVGLLLIALAAPMPHRFVLPYDLAMTFFFFPLLVLAGALSQPGAKFTKNFKWLGTTSYAIYVLHVPVYGILREGLRHVSPYPLERFAPWTGMAYMLCSILAALFLDKVYDVPARAFLRKRLLGKRKASAKLDERVKVSSSA